MYQHQNVTVSCSNHQQSIDRQLSVEIEVPACWSMVFPDTLIMKKKNLIEKYGIPHNHLTVRETPQANAIALGSPS